MYFIQGKQSVSDTVLRKYVTVRPILALIIHRLKGQSKEIFYPRYSIKRLILVRVDMPESSVEDCLIFVELFLFEVLNPNLDGWGQI
jgi:hypothetical protein